VLRFRASTGRRRNPSYRLFAPRWLGIWLCCHMFGAILAVISTYLEARFTNVRSCFVGSFPCQLSCLAVLPGFSRPSCCMYFGYTHHAAGLCINGWPGVFPTQNPRLPSLKPMSSQYIRRVTFLIVHIGSLRSMPRVRQLNERC
jgi:hypothetical protein